MTISQVHLMQANIGMWLNHQDSLKQWLTSMWAYFLASNPDFFRKNAEVQSYIKYISKNNPDILYLTEVCWVDQMEEISNKLLSKGYRIHVTKWFELWNMDLESHRYLSHIMATRSDFHHKKTIHQVTMNNGIRFMKWKNGLWKNIPNINNQVNAILDWGGSHYQIDGIEIGFMHAHANDTTLVFSELLESIRTDNSNQILAWDMNMSIDKAKILANTINPGLQLLETNKTYPYYFESSKDWIVESAIRSIMNKQFLSHPDQLFHSSWIKVLENQILWPKLTCLKTDHSVNHFKIHISSQR